MKGKRGFTLIEVLIVVIILGILATIAIPQFTKMVARSRTAEAYATLGALKTAQEVYRLEYAGYCDDLTNDKLAIEFPDGLTGSPNFEYSVDADATTYTLTATGDNNAAGVIVTLEQDGTTEVTLP